MIQHHLARGAAHLASQGGDDGGEKGWQVSRLAGGDKIAVHYHLGVLIDGSGMDQAALMAKKEVTVLPATTSAEANIQGP